jgi:type II secretory pathway pseudopilin PulG
MTRIATTHRRRTRPGFTIVELLVAAAVCVIIMAILATCFQSGIDTLRQLKSQGDLTDQLRAAEIVIRRDLQAKRFLTEDSKPNLGVRVSDQRIDSLTINGAVVTGWTPPRGGFLRIKSSDPITGLGSFYEGTDQDGLDVTRATDHYITFTSILPGGTDQNVYSALANTPSGQVFCTSPAAEIALFLDTGNPPSGYAGTVPLYNLVRRQRLAALYDSDAFNYPNSDAGVISVSAVTGRVNTLADLTNPNNRLTGPLGGVATCTPQPTGLDGYLAPLGGNRLGDDVLLSNVISFEVKVNWESAKYGIPALGLPHPSATPLPPWIDPRAFPGTPAPNNDNDNDGVAGLANSPQLDGNTDYPFDTLPGRTPGVPAGTNNMTGGFNNLLNSAPNGRYVFDSWTTAFANWNSAVVHNDAIPMRARVKSVQIRIRVFDPKLKNARQLTIVQDL